MTRRRPGESELARGAVAAIVLALFVYGLSQTASLLRAPVVFDVGPSTGGYLEGFTESEERPPVSFRWTTTRARARLPLRASEGAAVLTLRYARFLPSTARAHLYVAGERAAVFDARSGRFRTHDVPLTLGPGDRELELELVVEDPDPSGLGIALDWIRIDGARVRPSGALGLGVFVLVGFLLSLRLAGFELRWALALTGAASIAAAAWLSVDPFGAVHAASRLAFPFLGWTALLAAAVRFFPEPPASRWLVVAFALGFALKGAALFHPSYFYPDVRNHRRYVFAMAEAEGSLVERGVEAQRRVHTAFPRRVGERDYAFPYSPLPFVPFTWLPREPRLVEDALKHVALAAGSLEVVVVFWLGAAIAGARVGALAAAVAAILPPMYSRLLLAMWPTVLGHLLDVVVVAASVHWSRRPDSLARTAGVAAASVAALWTYISSLFNVTSFLAFLAILKRDLRWRAIAVAGVAVASTIAVWYLSFTITFVTEIVPSLLARGGGGAYASPPGGGVREALGRVTTFYGYAYPVLAGAGLAWLWRARRAAAIPLLAYALSFGLLVLLRGSLGTLFRDLKEILWVGPLVAVGTAASLHALASRGRWERVASVVLYAGLCLFWLGKYVEWLRLHASLAGMTD